MTTSTTTSEPFLGQKLHVIYAAQQAEDQAARDEHQQKIDRRMNQPFIDEAAELILQLPELLMRETVAKSGQWADQFHLGGIYSSEIQAIKQKSNWTDRQIHEFVTKICRAFIENGGGKILKEFCNRNSLTFDYRFDISALNINFKINWQG